MELESDVFDFPGTQPIPRPLAGVIAFIDVRSSDGGAENRGEAISLQLDSLGATVAKKFTKDVTHLVFKDGYQSNLNRAESRKLYIVSPLWIDGCLRVDDRISEAKYPVVSGEKKECALVLGKLKRLKSMQPKPIDEEQITKSVERKRKKIGKSSLKGVVAGMSNLEAVDDQVLCPDSDTDEDNGCYSNSDDCLVMEKVVSTGESKMNDSCIPSSPEDMFEGGETSDADINELFDAPVVQDASIHTTQPSVMNRTKTDKKPNQPSKKKISSKQKPRSQKTGRVFHKVSTYLPEHSSGGRSLDDPSHSRDRDKENCPTTDTSKTGSEKVKRQALSATNSVPPKKKSSSLSKKGRKHTQRSQVKSGPPTSVCRQPGLVLTSCSSRDKEVIEAVAKKLGGFILQSRVTMATTHVVCGAPRRTLNALAGSVRGCWLVGPEWVWKSLEAGMWVEENPFEMREEFPTAHDVRKAKGGSEKVELFQGSSVFVATAIPSALDIRCLVELGGGKVSGTHRKATVIVGGRFKDCRAPCVSDQWLLDSITENKILSTNDYSLTNHP